MADIVLLDRNDNPVTHRGAERINLINADGEEVFFEPEFDMRNTRWYYACAEIDASGFTNYKVVRSAVQGLGTTACTCAVTDEACKEMGYDTGTYYSLMLICSKKELEVGKTYYLIDILNG